METTWLNLNVTPPNFFLVGFSCGSAVKNPLAIVGDASLIPGWENTIPHAEMQISLSATTAEPTCCGARRPQGRSRVSQIRPDTAK